MSLTPTPKLDRPHGQVSRMVIISLDTLMEIIKDYTNGEVPTDASPLKLLFRPTDKGRIGILTSSPSWPTNESGPLEVRFQMRRFYGVI